MASVHYLPISKTRSVRIQLNDGDPTVYSRWGGEGTPVSEYHNKKAARPNLIRHKTTKEMSRKQAGKEIKNYVLTRYK